MHCLLDAADQDIVTDHVRVTRGSTKTVRDQFMKEEVLCWIFGLFVFLVYSSRTIKINKNGAMKEKQTVIPCEST